MPRYSKTRKSDADDDTNDAESAVQEIIDGKHHYRKSVPPPPSGASKREGSSSSSSSHKKNRSSGSKKSPSSSSPSNKKRPSSSSSGDKKRSSSSKSKESSSPSSTTNKTRQSLRHADEDATIRPPAVPTRRQTSGRTSGAKSNIHSKSTAPPPGASATPTTSPLPNQQRQMSSGTSGGVKPTAPPTRHQTSGSISTAMPPAPESLDRHVDRTAVSRPGAVSIPGGLTPSSPPQPVSDDDGDVEAPTSAATPGDNNIMSSRSDILVNAKLVTSERDLEEGRISAVSVPAAPLVKAETLTEFPTTPEPQQLGPKELLQNRSVQIFLVIFVAALLGLAAYVVLD